MPLGKRHLLQRRFTHRVKHVSGLFPQSWFAAGVVNAESARGLRAVRSRFAGEIGAALAVRRRFATGRRNVNLSRRPTRRAAYETGRIGSCYRHESWNRDDVSRGSFSELPG